MLSAVLHTISQHALIAAGDRILVAVSGGPDSMALMTVLWELAARLDIELEVATVDHGLRPGAAAEAALVAERAEVLGLPWHRLPVEVRPGGARGGIQEAARRARLEALAARAIQQGCVRVALGHQADDQAETVLFRIVRGTGLRGVAGIPHRRGLFVRPLLDVPRAAILEYLRRRSVPFASDPSNTDRRFSRARLRGEVLPLLRRENPRVDEALRRLGAEAAAALASGVVGKDDAITSLARAAGVHVSARLARAVGEAARRGGTCSFDVAGGRRLTVSYGQLSMGGVASPIARPLPNGEGRSTGAPVSIEESGVHRLGGASMAVVARFHEGPGEANAPADELARVQVAGAGPWVWFDLAHLARPLGLRGPRPGDRMRPRAGRGSRKLADLLIDAKVPRAARAGLPVVVTGAGDLLFVPGLRASQAGSPTPHTRRWVGLAGFPEAAKAEESENDSAELRR